MDSSRAGQASAFGTSRTYKIGFDDAEQREFSRALQQQLYVQTPLQVRQARGMTQRMRHDACMSPAGLHHAPACKALKCTHALLIHHRHGPPCWMSFHLLLACVSICVRPHFLPTLFPAHVACRSTHPPVTPHTRMIAKLGAKNLAVYLPLLGSPRDTAVAAAIAGNHCRQVAGEGFQGVCVCDTLCACVKWCVEVCMHLPFSFLELCTTTQQNLGSIRINLKAGLAASNRQVFCAEKNGALKETFFCENTTYLRSL